MLALSRELRSQAMRWTLLAVALAVVVSLLCAAWLLDAATRC